MVILSPLINLATTGFRVAFETAIYSAAAVDKATQFCFREINDSRLFPRVKIFPVVDILSSRFPAQSESQYVVKMGGGLFITNLRCLVVLKYLIIFSTASQSVSLGDSFFLPSILTVAACQAALMLSHIEEPLLPADTVCFHLMVCCADQN